MAGKQILSDGIIATRWHEQAHTGETVVEQVQDTTAILERNAELKKNPDALRDMDFGRQVASIPLVVYYDWQRKYPELRSTDSEVANAKFMQLLKQHPEFWVREKI